MRALSAPGATGRGAAGAAILSALLVALLPGAPAAAVVALAALGVGAMLWQLTPAAGRLLGRHPGLVLMAPLVGLAIVWLGFVTGAIRRSAVAAYLLPGSALPRKLLLPGRPGQALRFTWPVGALSPVCLLLPFVLVCGGAGLVLVCDAVRLQVGLTRSPQSLWRALTQTSSRPGRVMARAVPGLALIGLLTAVCVVLLRGYSATAGAGSTQTLGLLATVALATLLLAAPVTIGLAVHVERDQAGRTRDRERERFAAYLHDSVLQTLALIQRQAADPSAVSRLARRQEHALRAWMAGESELGSETIASAARDMVEEAEDEDGLAVEITVIGDGALDEPTRRLIAAAREALRNTARHAPGARANVFLDVDPVRIEMFVRDDGPGFDPAAVAPQRRGLRDSVLGRMAVAGGSAVVESRPGEGTEIVLRLPRSDGPRR